MGVRGVRRRRLGAAVALAVAAGTLLASCTTAAVGLAASSPPEPLAPTEAERAWARTGLPEDQRPAVEPIRLVSVFERAEAIAACLRAAGYPKVAVVAGKPDPGPLAEGQAASFALSTYMCEAGYPADPVFDRPLSDAQIRALYRYRAEEQRPCLESLGHAISAPPTERAFVEAYAERGGWNPMNSVPAFGFEAAVAACPPIPEGLFE